MAWSKTKGLLILVLVAGLISLTACSSSQDTSKEEKQSEDSHSEHESHQQDGSVEEMPKVEVKTEPKEVKTGKPTTIHAIITLEGKPVDDADSVSFDIWEDGSKEKDKIKAKRTAKGTYSIEKTFEEAGTYKVMHHVTARGHHVMDDQEVEVKP